MNKIIDEIESKEIGEIKENISFKALTTYKTGGNARYVVFPKNVEKLILLINILKENNIKFKIFGNGSNILASEKDYNGVIIKLNNLNNLKINDNIVEVDAGYSLLKLANDLSKQGLSGLEWACGIPGTIGGAVYMNAGAYKCSMSDILKSVKILDENLEIKELKKEDLQFEYRKSIFMNNNYICLSATLELAEKDIESVMTLVNERKERRVKTQPLNYPSAGSVFRNPENEFAGNLIEKSHLKGQMVGGAQISDVHANFIINRESATSDDIKELMDIAKEEVYDRYKINLKVEQELFNWE